MSYIPYIDERHRCDNCKYWCQLYIGGDERYPIKRGDKYIGWCRYLTPHIKKDDTTDWPRTLDLDSCGKFEPIETLADLWESKYYDQYSENDRLSQCVFDLKAVNRKFRNWLIKVTNPLTANAKRKPTQKLMQIIENHLKQSTEKTNDSD